jgi:16S rRNA processing protein RimM
LVAVGRVGRAHGIRGEMRVAPYNQGSTLLLERATLHIGGQQYQVGSARQASDVIILALEGVSTREAADLLKGAEVGVPRDELPAPAPDELYLADLVGCDCFEGQAALGRVVSVVNYPASTCLVLQGEGGTREIPAVAPYFAGLDLPARRIEIANASDFPLEVPRAKKSEKKART